MLEHLSSSKCVEFFDLASGVTLIAQTPEFPVLDFCNTPRGRFDLLQSLYDDSTPTQKAGTEMLHVG